MFLVVGVWSLTSCGGDTPYQDVLPEIVGLSGEVIVILDEKNKEEALGQVIFSDLSAPCPQFLSFETQFNADLYGFSHFSKVIQRFRNLIIIDVKDTSLYDVPKTVFVKDKWADGQIVITIHAKDTVAVIQEYREQSNRIKEVFNTADRERYIDIIKKSIDPVSKEKIKEKFGFSMDIPKDYFLVTKGDNHLGFKKEKSVFKNRGASQVIQTINIRVEPFDNDSAFSHRTIIQKVDSITGKYFQSSDNNGLVIEKSFPPIFKEINFDGQYGVEMKALWKFESPLMGDPYTSLTIHDPAKNRVITVEGFMFAPRFDKREFMKEIEAILYTLKL